MGSYSSSDACDLILVFSSFDLSFMGFILDGILEKLEEMEELEDVLGLAYVSSGIEIVDFAEGVIVDDDGDGSDKLDEVEEEDEYVTTNDAGMDESD